MNAWLADRSAYSPGGLVFAVSRQTGCMCRRSAEGSDIRKLHSMQKFSVMEKELLSRGEAPILRSDRTVSFRPPGAKPDPAPEAASEALAEPRPPAPGRAQEVEQGDRRRGGDRNDG